MTVTINGVAPSALQKQEFRDTFEIPSDSELNSAIVTERTTAATLTNKTINLSSNTLQATSAQLAAAVSDETGSGALVFANSPAFSGTVTASGQFLVGMSTPINATEGLQVTNQSGGNAVVAGYTVSDSVVSNFRQYRRRATGTTGVLNGDHLGVNSFWGWDNLSGTYRAAAHFNAAVDGTPALNSIPTQMQFRITKPGATAISTQMTLRSDGTLELAEGKLGVSQANAHTIPNVSADTFALLNATQTLTNKTLSNSTLNNTALNTATLNSSVLNGVRAGTTWDIADRAPIQPSLDLDFANQRYRVYDGAVGLKQIALADILTYTGSGRTYTDALGILRTQASNVPRIEFDPITGVGLGLSVWGTRTNLITRSNEFDNTSAWSAIGSTVTPNISNGPDGALQADRVTEDSTNNPHYIGFSASFTSGVTYTFSVYAREISTGSKRWMSLLFPANIFGTNKRATFDLAAGTFVLTNSPDSATMTRVATRYGDMWRCSVTATATVSGVAGAQIRISVASADSLAAYQGDGVSGLLLSCAQLEEGSGPSPYIPTTASSVTAPADIAGITGANFSKWFNPNEGTFVALWMRQDSAGSRLVFSADDGSSSNQFRFRYNLSNTSIDNAITTAGTSVAFEGMGGVMLQANTLLKAAQSYSAKQASVSFNGLAVQSDFGAIELPTVNRMGIGGTASGTEVLCGVIQRILYFPRELPANLQALSA